MIAHALLVAGVATPEVRPANRLAPYRQRSNESDIRDQCMRCGVDQGEPCREC